MPDRVPLLQAGDSSRAYLVLPFVLSKVKANCCRAGGMLTPWLSHYLGCLHTIFKSLALSPDLTSDFNFLLMCHVGGR